MRRLFGFIAVPLLFATIVFAQRRNEPSGGSSSSGSSSSPSPSPSYSPPSYSPPSSSSSSSGNSGSSRSSDSGSSRSYDSGSRSSSSSSSSSGSYTPPSRSSSSEPSSRGSSSSSSSSSSYHPNTTNNSSGSSNSGGTRDFRNGAPAQNKHEFPANSSSREPATRAFHDSDQRPNTLPNSVHGDLDPSRTGQSQSSGHVVVDRQLLDKYAPKEWKIREQQNKLDQKSKQLYTKYKLAGKDGEYERRQAKLDEKRNKLLNKEDRLARKYLVEAERRRPPCMGKDCPAPCPPGHLGPRGCNAPPPPKPTPPTTTPVTLVCGSGYYLINGRCFNGQYDSSVCLNGYYAVNGRCVEDGSSYQLGRSTYTSTCNAQYARLTLQKKLLDNLRNAAQSACAGNVNGQECLDLMQQVNEADTRYHDLQQEYMQCQTANSTVSAKPHHP